ncbi:MAG: alpha/beta hydrolase [Roseibium sp.]
MDHYVLTDKPLQETGGTSRPAQPFYFNGLAGYFHPATGRTAVLLVSPWGYEELCARKSYRILGEKLAEAGYPCLRFDFPATGNSSGAAAVLDDDGAWRKAVRDALSELRRRTGAERVVAIGQGIGATLAAGLAADGEADGLVLLAPVLQGRAYLRELAAWTAMTRPTFLVNASDGPEGGLMAGGFVLSAATAGEIKSLNLLKMTLPQSVRTLLVERLEHPGDLKLADQLTSAGKDVERMTFEGYADYVSDPTLSVVPEATLDAVVHWIGRCFSPVPAEAAASPEDASVLQAGPGVEEEAVRFGPDGMFFGVLARPVSGSPKTAVVILNSGYDHSIGWARTAVGFARRLAGEGHAVLRMDLAGMGESRYWPGQARQVLYSDRQVEDVGAAIDFLIARTGLEKVVLCGRCSGAYLALLAASRETRVGAAYLINPRRLVWDPDENVDLAIREPIQSLETYGRKVFDRDTLKRVLSGDINVVSACVKLRRAATRKLDRVLGPVFGSLSKHQRLFRILRDRLNRLADRKVAVRLVYSENDRGIPDMENWFGKTRQGLAAYPDVTLHFVANADHNLTPEAAREEVQSDLSEFLAAQENEQV